MFNIMKKTTIATFAALTLDCNIRGAYISKYSRRTSVCTTIKL